MVAMRLMNSSAVVTVKTPTSSMTATGMPTQVPTWATGTLRTMSRTTLTVHRQTPTLQSKTLMPRRRSTVSPTMPTVPVRRTPMYLADAYIAPTAAATWWATSVTWPCRPTTPQRTVHRTSTILTLAVTRLTWTARQSCWPSAWATCTSCMAVTPMPITTTTS